MTRKGVKRKRVVSTKSKVKKASSVFLCHLCYHEGAVECKMNRARGIGYITCRVCGIEHQSSINNLSQPIDVYSDWIDSFETREKKLHAKQSRV